MKHLPNLLTLANLFCGCIAISYILGAQNFNIAFTIHDYIEVPAIEQPYIGSFFIFLAAVFDMLDGFAARALKVFSPIGKDLDSLADIVSFGVAPSVILFKMLWNAHIAQPDAMDISMLATTPAFLVACFAALRLARFNQDAAAQSKFFTGLPVPTVGILVATFPLIIWQNPLGHGSYFYNYSLLYAIIGLCCWLMVSKIKFFKLMPDNWSIAHLWPRLLVVLSVGISYYWLQSEAIVIGFIVYIISSFIYKPKEA